MAHHHIQRQYRIVRYLAGAALERLLQVEQGHLRDPLDRDAEHPILALARQRYLQLDAIVPDREQIARVQIVAPVEHGLQRAEHLAVRVHHRFDDFAIHLARALVRLDVNVVVVHEPARHRDLEVVGPQHDRAALPAQVGPARACEDR